MRAAFLEMAVALAKPVRPDIKLGICGEHGGEPESVKFCHKVGLNYVSCSPFRVPIARLAAAQATLLGAPSGTSKQASDLQERYWAQGVPTSCALFYLWYNSDNILICRRRK